MKSEVVPLREVAEKIREERKRLEEAGVEELLREIVKQIKISNMDPEYWEIIPIDVDVPTVIPARGQNTIVEVRERGKVLAIGATVDNPNVYFEAQIDEMKFGASFQELYDFGLIGFNSAIYWISRYDTDNDVYTAWWTPNPPREYMGYIRITFYNPTNSNVSFKYSIYRYRFKGLR